MSYKYQYQKFRNFLLTCCLLVDLALTFWGWKQFFTGDVTHGLLALVVAGLGALHTQHERIHGGAFS